MHEVHLDTGLSRPWPECRKAFHPDFGETSVLPDAPFLIKVAMPNRRSEAQDHLRVRRFTGAHRREAIQLVPGRAKKYSFPAPLPSDSVLAGAGWSRSTSCRATRRSRGQ